MTNLLRALIADPDDRHRMGVARLLNEAGFECLHARDGVEAVQFASELGLDLIVCALDLPRLSCEELLSLREKGVFGASPPPVVVFAAHQEEAKARLSPNDCSILAKPLLPEVFRETLSGFLGDF